MLSPESCYSCQCDVQDPLDEFATEFRNNETQTTAILPVGEMHRPRWPLGLKLLEGFGQN